MPVNLLNKIKRRQRPANGSVVVEIYSKPDCHLCEEAKAVLLKMQQRHGFQLREVNIADDETLLAEYGTRIPLVFVNNHLVCKYFVDEAAVVRQIRLERNRQTNVSPR
ncbi:MAG: glutaredoxin family protein [candidate division KSB1 bacterium]|nr:glutaredoxin family protein [candidate division KSB1 bacterium]MDZ7368900.1 glutaredoxin family protein [candidate division KSB1 bacterium]MDZ7406888.1 glutaredoxin family protein [candidate division KSB1 bacterium]